MFFGRYLGPNGCKGSSEYLWHPSKWVPLFPWLLRAGVVWFLGMAGHRRFLSFFEKTATGSCPAAKWLAPVAVVVFIAYACRTMLDGQGGAEALPCHLVFMVILLSCTLHGHVHRWANERRDVRHDDGLVRLATKLVPHRDGVGGAEE